MADVEEPEQDNLIASLKDAAAIDVVKVPHHGGPLSDKFLQAFADKICVISTSENPWGLPREKDMARWKGKVYRTDEDGTVVFETDGSRLNVHTLSE